MEVYYKFCCYGCKYKLVAMYVYISSVAMDVYISSVAMDVYKFICYGCIYIYKFGCYGCKLLISAMTEYT